VTDTDFDEVEPIDFLVVALPAATCPATRFAPVVRSGRADHQPGLRPGFSSGAASADHSPGSPPTAGGDDRLITSKQVGDLCDRAVFADDEFNAEKARALAL